MTNKNKNNLKVREENILAISCYKDILMQCALQILAFVVTHIIMQTIINSKDIVNKHSE